MPILSYACSDATMIRFSHLHVLLVFNRLISLAGGKIFARCTTSRQSHNLQASSGSTCIGFSSCRLSINAFASVDSFATLLEQGISATEPVIHSSNSLFVANDSWSRMVAMAANNPRPCKDWG